MKYIDFYQKFKSNLLIKTTEIKIYFPLFDLRDLSKWQKKGYIKKIRKGLYVFSDYKFNLSDLFYIANNLNEPSYIGLHSALSYYSIIPEGVFTITNISTNRINKQNTNIGSFDYCTIKKNLFWGYLIKTVGNTSFYISDLEKTILDFLYFNSNIKDFDDFEGIRFNTIELSEKLNFEKIDSYLKVFNNSKLSDRFYNLKKYIYA